MLSRAGRLASMRRNGALPMPREIHANTARHRARRRSPRSRFRDLRDHPVTQGTAIVPIGRCTPAPVRSRTPGASPCSPTGRKHPSRSPRQEPQARPSTKVHPHHKMPRTSQSRAVRSRLPRPDNRRDRHSGTPAGRASRRGRCPRCRSPRRPHIRTRRLYMRPRGDNVATRIMGRAGHFGRSVHRVLVR